MDPALTFRSLLIGCLVGSILTSSNLYIGLKAGWSTGTNLFSAISGFFFLSAWTKFLTIFQKHNHSTFTIEENCILQTTSTAAGSLTAGFVMAIPCLIWFGNSYSLFSLFLWTLSAAYYGMFFAVPLRNYAILIKQLRFPSGLATAETLRQLFASKTSPIEEIVRIEGEHQNEDDDMTEEEEFSSQRTVSPAVVLLSFFCASFFFVFLGSYIPVLYTLPIFYWLAVIEQWIFSSSFDACLEAACYTTSILWTISEWRWAVNVSPAFMGIGMLMGFRAAFSYFAGSLVAFGILGPLLVDYFHVLDLSWGYVDPLGDPSAQYWMLWPGIVLMTVSSFTEVMISINYKSLYDFLKGLVFQWQEKEIEIEMMELPEQEDLELSEEGVEEREENETKKEGVARWIWVSGVISVSIFTLFVLTLFFDVVWYEVIIALILAFILSLVAVQVSGETDINPIGPVAHVVQIVFAFIAPNQPSSNVIAGNICASSAAQSVDMLTDLKTGYELGVNPLTQLIAQGVGSLAGVFSAVTTFQIMITAYPCLLSLDTIGDCAFTAPAASAWYGFTLALTSGGGGDDPIFPPYCLIAMAGCAIVSVLCPILEKRFPNQKTFIPSIPSFGLAFITMPYISGAMFIGAILLLIWSLINKQSKEKYAYAVAAGMTAGEGVAGVGVAILMIASISFQWCFLMPSIGEFSC